MHDLSPLYSSGLPPTVLGIIGKIAPIIFAVVICIIILKGIALWHAARNNQKWWFIAILVINTIGILEIIYLIWFRPDTSQSSTPTVSSETQG